MLSAQVLCNSWSARFLCSPVEAHVGCCSCPGHCPLQPSLPPPVLPVSAMVTRGRCSRPLGPAFPPYVTRGQFARRTGSQSLPGVAAVCLVLTPVLGKVACSYGAMVNCRLGLSADCVTPRVAPAAGALERCSGPGSGRLEATVYCCPDTWIKGHPW